MFRDKLLKDPKHIILMFLITVVMGCSTTIILYAFPNTIAIPFTDMEHTRQISILILLTIPTLIAIGCSGILIFSTGKTLTRFHVLLLYAIAALLGISIGQLYNMNFAMTAFLMLNIAIWHHLADYREEIGKPFRKTQPVIYAILFGILMVTIINAITETGIAIDAILHPFVFYIMFSGLGIIATMQFARSGPT